MCSTGKITKTLTQKAPVKPYIISKDGRTVVYKPLKKSLERFLQDFNHEYFTVPEILTKATDLYYVEYEKDKKDSCVIKSYIRRRKSLETSSPQKIYEPLELKIANILWQNGQAYKKNIDEFDAILFHDCYIKENAYILRPHPEGDKLYLAYLIAEDTGEKVLRREVLTRDHLQERLDILSQEDYVPLKYIDKKKAYKAPVDNVTVPTFDSIEAGRAMYMPDKLLGLLTSSEEAQLRSMGFNRSR